MNNDEGNLMFAIRFGTTGKFVNKKPYTDLGFTISAKPKTIATKEEAQKVIAQYKKNLQNTLDGWTAYNNNKDVEYVNAVAAIAKDTKALEKLYELPYKDVYKRVAMLEKRVKSNQQIIDSRKTMTFSKREIVRLQSMAATDMIVVKVQQTVAVA